MNEYQKSKIHRFAVRYKNLYEILKNEIPALYDDFAARLAELGFSMDSGKSLTERYGLSEFPDTEKLMEILHETDEIELLGNAVFARWHQINADDTQSFLDENNRAWMKAVLGRMAELSETENKHAWDFGAALKSAKIISCKVCDQNEPETEQRLIINDSGKGSLTRLKYDHQTHKSVIFDKRKVQMEEEQAKLILNEISMYFAKENFEMIMMDDPYYEITLQAHDSRTYQVKGLLSEEDSELAELSEMIRELLNLDMAFVFDGKGRESVHGREL